MKNVKKYLNLFFLLMLVFLINCSENKSKGNDNANVFRPLDGIWEGEFKVYIDTRGQEKGIAQPEEIDYDVLKNPDFKIHSIIKAKHIYRSVSDYKQEGEILDIITKSDGTTDTIKSKATNLVEYGKLKCFVYKPNETVIHDGEYLGNNTIVWHRNIKQPKRIEYFKETVDTLHYKIIGWGYYGKDNPKLTPRIWFYADYIRTYGE